MGETIFYLASSFWTGAVHAATPGHGKTISAAYIVGARGRPLDAVILGVFVTLSHTSGILLVGLLASLGSAWLMPQRVEAYLALVMGSLVVVLGFWLLWTQRGLVRPALGLASPRGHRHDGHSHDHAHDHGHDHHHDGDHDHDHHHDHSHAPGGDVVWHSHGWGTAHAHQVDLLTEDRPRLGALLALGIAGGLLPDPAALALLLAAISSGKLVLGLLTVLVFSIGFAFALVVVGVIAAQLGRRVLSWLDGIWSLRLQLATTALILGTGLVLLVRAVWQVSGMRTL